jgi:hypothetical protein
MQVVWEYLVHEENENRCLDKGDTLETRISKTERTTANLILSINKHPLIIILSLRTVLAKINVTKVLTILNSAAKTLFQLLFIILVPSLVA